MAYQTVSTARTTRGRPASPQRHGFGARRRFTGRTVALVAVDRAGQDDRFLRLGCTPAVATGSTLLAAIDGTVTTGATNGVETVRAGSSGDRNGRRLVVSTTVWEERDRDAAVSPLQRQRVPNLRSPTTRSKAG